MFTNTTVLDKKAIYALNKKTYNIIYFVFGCAIISLTCAIFLSVLNYEKEFFGYGLTAGLTFAGIFLLYSVKKAQKQSVGKKVTYCFNENSFTITEGGNFSDLPYSIITSIKENNDYAFLYISKTQAYIVSKKDMPQEFFEFIKSKIQ